jgi:hypothetical protein
MLMPGFALFLTRFRLRRRRREGERGIRTALGGLVGRGWRGRMNPGLGGCSLTWVPLYSRPEASSPPRPFFILEENLVQLRV